MNHWFKNVLIVNYLGVIAASHYDNNEEDILDSSLTTATPFGIGSGHLNPNSAADPGLVYDNVPSNYYNFLCSLGYNATQISIISGNNYNCPANNNSVSNFNYPSISVTNITEDATIQRSVTNVGSPTSIYTVSVQPPLGIDVIINPSVLEFSNLGEVQSFSVTLKIVEFTKGEYVFGSYTWNDGTYSVHSPLVVQTKE